VSEVLTHKTQWLETMLPQSTVSDKLYDSLFWLRGGNSWQDRFRLLHFWLSPRFCGEKPGPPTAVFTPFRRGVPIYLRSASPDVRVFRNIFERGDYRLPSEITGIISTIVDLGAYTGISTAYFAERYPSARIVALEPDPDNYSCLQHNLNGILHLTRVSALRACVAKTTGTVRFGTEGQSWERAISEKGDIVVPSFTLTDLFAHFDLESVDILKMDIEGGEKDVFEAETKWFHLVGWILLEVHLDAMSLSKLVELMSEIGRRIFMRANGGFPQFIELRKSECEAMEEKTRFVDVIIPPVDKANALLSI